MFSFPLRSSPIINHLSYEMLQTPQGRKAYFTYLDYHPELTPLQKLYGMQSPAVVSPEQLDSHVRKMSKYIHPDKVPEEEKEMCTQLFHLIMNAKDGHKTPELPAFEFFMQAAPAPLRMQYHHAAAAISQAFLPFAKTLIDIADDLLMNQQELDQTSTPIKDSDSSNWRSYVAALWNYFSAFYVTFFDNSESPSSIAIPVSDIRNLIKKTKELLYHLECINSEEELIKQAEQWRTDLVLSGFLIHCEPLEFIWNESYFNSSSTEENPLCRFLILLTLFFLYPTERPLDQLLRECSSLCHLNSPLVDAIFIILGILSLEKMDEKRASIYFQSVPQNDQLKKVIDDALLFTEGLSRAQKDYEKTKDRTRQ